MKRLAFCVATHLLVTVTVVSVAFAGQLTRAPRQLPALVVRTLRPVAQTNSTVTLRGVVNPRGQAPTQYRFQYKVASRRHAVIEATSPEAVTVGRRVHARTRRLAPQTTYESRIVAWNRRGTAYGRWVSAKTPANAEHGARQRRFAAARRSCSDDRRGTRAAVMACAEQRLHRALRRVPRWQSGGSGD